MGAVEQQHWELQRHSAWKHSKHIRRHRRFAVADHAVWTVVKLNRRRGGFVFKLPDGSVHKRPGELRHRQGNVRRAERIFQRSRKWKLRKIQPRRIPGGGYGHDGQQDLQKIPECRRPGRGAGSRGRLCKVYWTAVWRKQLQQRKKSVRPDQWDYGKRRHSWGGHRLGETARHQRRDVPSTFHICKPVWF